MALLLAVFAVGQGSAQRKPDNAACLSCHSDASLSADEHGVQHSLYVDGKKLEHSIHGPLLACVDCHTDVKGPIHDTTPKKISCADCHADAQDAFAHSTHAKATRNGKSTDCQDCHGGPHEILAASDPQSPVSHRAIPTTCGRCHGQKFLMASNGQDAQSFYSYQNSVHGRATENGKDNAAVCTDCHGAHAILPPSDARSPIYKFNVPQTCGRCHAQVAETFRQSIHGQGIARGNGMSPVCTDCHGIHSIQSHVDPNSPVSQQNLARSTCARCHEGVRLSREFSVAGNRVSSYLDSYHGLASEGGSAVVANCASCHGVHNILPSSDARSTIHPANLARTCGQCHPGVTRKFIETKVHIGGESALDRSTIAMRWVRCIYLPLIFLIIGAMFLHNALVWRAKAVRIRAMQHPLRTRMSRQQRWQHLVLLSSFLVLVVTGFALRFPNSWIAAVLGDSEKWRSLVHRIAGIALIAAGFYHLIYLASTREGRKLFRDFLPSAKDLVDLIRMLAWTLSLRKEKPVFARFSYAEKAEYWALVWGTALMAVTGIMMWARVSVGNLLARWWVDVATAIHYYEAILATLAILVWHFYQVFVDPDASPMNWAWWDGKVSEEEYRREHGLDPELSDKDKDS